MFVSVLSCYYVLGIVELYDTCSFVCFYLRPQKFNSFICSRIWNPKAVSAANHLNFMDLEENS